IGIAHTRLGCSIRSARKVGYVPGLWLISTTDLHHHGLNKAAANGTAFAAEVGEELVVARRDQLSGREPTMRPGGSGRRESSRCSTGGNRRTLECSVGPLRSTAEAKNQPSRPRGRCLS